MTAPEGLVIFGAGGHATSVADVARAAGYTIEAFIDPGKAGERLLGAPVAAAFEGDVTRHLFCIALGDNSARERARAGEASAYPLDRFPAIIHPTASVSRFATVGNGTVVMAGARIGPNSAIGAFCIVNTRAALDHDCRVHDYATVAPGVITGGFVSIGQRTTVAIGAVVKNGITIGADTILGAASYLNKDLPANCVAYGSPAQIVRTNDAD